MRSLRCLLLGLWLLAPAQAQSQLWRFRTPQFSAISSTWYGYDVGAAGDVDGDGHPDLIAGAPFADYVEVRSAFDGRKLLTWKQPYSPGPSWFGQSIAGNADATGDGRPDLLVGERSPNGGLTGGRVHIFDGNGGAELFDIGASGPPLTSLGSSVAWIGDVDGDGRADLAAGAPLKGPGFYFGAAFVFSSASGAILFQDAGTTSFAHLGDDVTGPGDMNGDGVPDVAWSAPYPDGVSFNGLVRVRSGADGSVLHELNGVPLVSVGAYLAPAGDLNADGVPDLLLANGNTPEIRSGTDFSVLLSIPMTSATAAGGRDLDGDGIPDVAVGRPSFSSLGSVVLVSGADASVLGSVAGEVNGDFFGFSVALPGDVNGDGREDVAAGAYQGDGVSNAKKGTVRVFDFGAPGFRVLGGGAAGSAGLPTLSATGATQANDKVVVELHHAAPGAPVVFVSSLEVAALPVKSGVLVPQADIAFTGLVTDALGSAVLVGRWPPDAAGSPRWMQFWIQDPSAPGGWAASHGLCATTE
jgi:hypothetical protein